MGWFEEEFGNLKKKMKWGFKDLDAEEDKEDKEDKENVLTPLVTIKENKKAVLVKFKLPEISKKDVTVKITSDKIEVRAERNSSIEIKKQGIHKSEHSHVKYYRELPLPGLVDHNAAKIDFKNGILKIIIPKIKRTIKFKLKKK